MTTAKTSRAIWSVIAAGALLAVCLVPTGAQARGPMGPGGGWGGGLMLGIPLETLNLTPDQQASIRSIVSSSRATARPIIQQLWQARRALADQLVASPSSDISAQLALINGLRSQLLQNSAQTMVQVLGVLTPDQLAKAAQVRAQLQQLHGQIKQLLSPSQP